MNHSRRGKVAGQKMTPTYNLLFCCETQYWRCEDTVTVFLLQHTVYVIIS